MILTIAQALRLKLQVDLTWRSESASASATDLLLGQAFTFSATVVNRGNGTAAATTLHYYRIVRCRYFH